MVRHRGTGFGPRTDSPQTGPSSPEAEGGRGLTRAPWAPWACPPHRGSDAGPAAARGARLASGVRGTAVAACTGPRFITRTTCAGPRAAPEAAHGASPRKAQTFCPIPDSRDRWGPASPGPRGGADAWLQPWRQARPSGVVEAAPEGGPGQSLRGPSPSACTAAARLTRWSASSMASAGPSGRSRDSPMTRIRISVSSKMGTSEQRRRKKLRAEQAGVGSAGAARAHGKEKPQLRGSAGQGRGQPPPPLFPRSGGPCGRGPAAPGKNGRRHLAPSGTNTQSTAHHLLKCGPRRAQGTGGRGRASRRGSGGPVVKTAGARGSHRAGWTWTRGDGAVTLTRGVWPADPLGVDSTPGLGIRKETRHRVCSRGPRLRGPPGADRPAPSPPCTHSRYAHLRSLSGGQLSHL